MLLEVITVILLGKKNIGIEEGETNNHQEEQDRVNCAFTTESVVNPGCEILQPLGIGIIEEAGQNGRECQNGLCEDDRDHAGHIHHQGHTGS